MTITVGHSPDPDDAFMFYGLRSGAVRVPGVAFRHLLRDIETLNALSERGALPVTALSLHQYAHVSHRYLLLPHGASVGDGYGPIVVSRKPPRAPSREGRVIAVPGERTTAYLALKLWRPRARTVSMPFDRIAAAVRRGTVDAGVLIHEGQLTYRSLGLHLVTDLGAWWKRVTGLPLVLGVNAIREDLGGATVRLLSRALLSSIRYGLAHRADALRYALGFGRGIAHGVADRFVAMYVNRDSLRFDARTRRGMRVLLSRAFARGLLPSVPRLRFAR